MWHRHIRTALRRSDCATTSTDRPLEVYDETPCPAGGFVVPDPGRRPRSSLSQGCDTPTHERRAVARADLAATNGTTGVGELHLRAERRGAALESYGDRVRRYPALCADPSSTERSGLHQPPAVVI